MPPACPRENAAPKLAVASVEWLNTSSAKRSFVARATLL